MSAAWEVWSTTASILFLKCKSDHVCPQLQSLHWFGIIPYVLNIASETFSDLPPASFPTLSLTPPHPSPPPASTVQPSHWLAAPRTCHVFPWYLSFAYVLPSGTYFLHLFSLWLTFMQQESIWWKINSISPQLGFCITLVFCFSKSTKD